MGTFSISVTILQNLIISLPTYPEFSWHETGTTHIFHLGLMCRNCYSKLQNLDQRCRLFYEGCQRNARIVMRANTKRMMCSSPLSGPQKRINFSKTPTKHNAKHNCLKRVPPLKVPRPRKLALKWILLLVGCVSRF